MKINEILKNKKKYEELEQENDYILFLIDGEEIVYITSTKSVVSTLKKLKKIRKFDSYSYQIDYSKTLKDKLIKEYKPKYNKIK